MRKILAGAIIAAGALTLSACTGGHEATADNAAEATTGNVSDFNEAGFADNTISAVDAENTSSEANAALPAEADTGNLTGNATTSEGNSL